VREEVEGDPGDDSSDPEQGKILDHAIARNRPHRYRIGCARRHIKGRMS
jgi:hypothetical protein